jgi:pilus assembly protein TadC
MFYRLFPRGYRNKIGEMLTYTGIKSSPERYINKSVVISLVVGTAASILAMEYLLPAFIAGFIGMFIMMNGWLMLAIDKRRDFVERVLPDALELMAANIRAGFIPSRAIMLSARPEFGPLSEAIKKSGKEIMTGKSFSEGLSEIPRHIKSRVLEHTIKLIAEGSRAGGQLVSLLDENAIDIRRRQAIQKEIKANILMYGIFIVFAGVLAAPLLYSLSGFLVTTLGSIGPSGAVPESLPAGMKMFSLGSSISPDFLFIYSFMSIAITSVFSGMIIGIIGSGREKEGFKYVPIFVVVSLAIFMASRILVGMMFSGFGPK